MVHLFLPEVVEIRVEIAVNLFVVVRARFTWLFSTGNIHFQYSLWTVTMEFQFVTWLCARLFLAEIRLVDLSGSNFHGHGEGWLLTFPRLAGMCWASFDTPESSFHWVRDLFTE